jgi:hypothetical protein
MSGQREGDRPRSGADIGDSDGTVLREPFEHSLNEVFSLRPGDEYGWRDPEGKTIELLHARDVLNGFVELASSNKVFVVLEFVRSEATSWIGEQGCPGEIEPML